jgi:hypothetical protein
MLELKAKLQPESTESTEPRWSVEDSQHEPQQPEAQPEQQTPLVPSEEKQPSDQRPATEQSQLEQPQSDHVVLEAIKCSRLAPCHVNVGTDNDNAMTCVQFYAKRFWDRVPRPLLNELQWQRDHRPDNCWYETELLTLVHAQTDAEELPYANAVCDGHAPSSVVYWHNFKSGRYDGTPCSGLPTNTLVRFGHAHFVR